MDKDQIIEAIKAMTVLELNELVKACEEEFVCKFCLLPFLSLYMCSY